MNLRNTRLVFRRELYDQLRDRRTIFTIVVIPMILYPLMGMALLQTAQFMRQETAKVWVIDAHLLEGEPAFFDGSTISSDFASPQLVSSAKFEFLSSEQANEPGRKLITEALATRHKSGVDDGAVSTHGLMKSHGVDVIVLVDSAADSDQQQKIHLLVNSASERSSVAAMGVNEALQRWRNTVIEQKVKSVNASLLASAQVEMIDLAPVRKRQAAVWAKLLPFIVLIWALTGAFYPAIDLCAGEKERGTLETLLSSPAGRSEIVAGKLLTVTTFSIATALLNLASMVFTGLLVIGQLANIPGAAVGANVGLPPVSALPWLVLGLIPVSALFSALALALAAFARSSKEGQYYLIPLLMSLLPLMMLSMLPGAQLDLGTSLIPVTGLMLLMRSLIIGEYALAAQFAGPVLAVTLVCCWMAMRWAVYQFNNESVLFRSGEQFGVRKWLRHLVRQRGLRPTIGEALLCGILILVIKFFVSLNSQLPLSFGGFARHVVITQVATIALPAILLALFLTRGPKISLKLTAPRWSSMPAFILLAILLHPAVMALSHVVLELYPPSTSLENVQVAIGEIFSSAPSVWAIVLVIAVVPAFCEEIAFRGFILSGLQSIRGRWSAIMLSSLFFGAAHGIIQQSVIATVVGVVLGIIAVRTNSLFPCIAYHAAHNALPVLMSAFPRNAVEGSWMQWFLEYSATTGAIQYTPMATVFMSIAGIMLFAWIWRSTTESAATGELGSNSQLATASAG